MSNAKLDKTIIKIKSSKHHEFFHADGEVVKFDGFLNYILSQRIMFLMKMKMSYYQI